MCFSRTNITGPAVHLQAGEYQYPFIVLTLHTAPALSVTIQVPGYSVSGYQPKLSEYQRGERRSEHSLPIVCTECHISFAFLHCDCSFCMVRSLVQSRRDSRRYRYQSSLVSPIPIPVKSRLAASLVPTHLDQQHTHLTAPRSRLRWASVSAIPMLIYVFRLPSSSLHSTPPRPCVVITPLRPIGRNMRANGLLLPHTPTLLKD